MNGDYTKCLFDNKWMQKKPLSVKHPCEIPFKKESISGQKRTFSTEIYCLIQNSWYCGRSSRLNHIQMKFILLSRDPMLVEKHFGPLDFNLTEYECTDFTIKQQVTLRILMLAIICLCIKF